MHSYFSYCAAALAAALAIGCDGTPVMDSSSLFYHPPDTRVDVEPRSLHAGVVMPDHPFLQEEAVMAICEEWNGLTCRRVYELEDAKAEIVIDESDCRRDEDGTVILGFADRDLRNPYGTVILFPACFTPELSVDAGQSYTKQQMSVALLALLHEIGHLIGMYHLPPSCDEYDASVPPFVDGEGIVCGAAVMNPFIDVRIQHPTDIDYRGFAVRDRYGIWPKAKDAPEADFLSEDEHASVEKALGHPTGFAGGCTMRGHI